MDTATRPSGIPSHSPRYTEALACAAELHRNQWRKGKAVPYIAHLITVSALVWEDGGSEDQAIAALLHDAIEDAGQSHASIDRQFGTEVADIVLACTDTEGPVALGGEKEPWIIRKTRTIEQLGSQSEAALLVMAADKAHNARDMVVDTRVDPRVWGKFRAGLDGSAWYLWSVRDRLKDQLPGSRSVALLGEAVEEILRSPALLARVPAELTPEAWVKGYLERPQTHPKD
ncbi:HD domain-containing protein [Cyanobium sp. FGCU-6]|nr:HD domain-containing protein [Cyanobium sp. FGCU6]